MKHKHNHNPSHDMTYSVLTLTNASSLVWEPQSGHMCLWERDSYVNCANTADNNAFESQGFYSFKLKCMNCTVHDIETAENEHGEPSDVCVCVCVSLFLSMCLLN